MRQLKLTAPAVLSSGQGALTLISATAQVTYPDGSTGFGSVYLDGRTEVALTGRGAWYFVETGGYAAPSPVSPLIDPLTGIPRQPAYPGSYQGGGILPPPPSSRSVPGYDPGVPVAADIGPRGSRPPPQFPQGGGGGGGFPWWLYMGWGGLPQQVLDVWGSWR